MYNQATLLGRVGRLGKNTLPDGRPVSNISLATSSKYTNSMGEKIDKTVWHNINCFGQLSDIVEKYVCVGDVLLIIGTIDSHKYNDKNGIERRSFYVNAHRIQMLPKPKSDYKQQSSEADNHPADFTSEDGDFF